RSVMEIRRARRQPAENGTFELADIGALSGDQRASWIGDLKHLPGKRPLLAGQGEYRQTGDVEHRRALGTRIGDTDVERRLDGVVAHIGCVVAGAAESRIARDPEGVVEARNTRDVDVSRVEHLFTPRD